MAKKSTERRVQKPYAEDGRCSWCGTHDLPKGRRRWCSQDCVEKYLMVSDPSYIRKQVKKRDKGICAHCGEDTLLLARRLRFLKSRRYTLGHYHIGHVKQRKKIQKWGRERYKKVELRYTRLCRYLYDKLREELTTRGFSRNRTSLWDADHIVPVVEGGGACGLENFRTLCIPCHKKETKALAGRRAAARKKVTK